MIYFRQTVHYPAWQTPPAWRSRWIKTSPKSCFQLRTLPGPDQQCEYGCQTHTTQRWERFLWFLPQDIQWHEFDVLMQRIRAWSPHLRSKLTARSEHFYLYKENLQSSGNTFKTYTHTHTRICFNPSRQIFSVTTKWRRSDAAIRDGLSARFSWSVSSFRDLDVMLRNQISSVIHILYTEVCAWILTNVSVEIWFPCQKKWQVFTVCPRIDRQVTIKLSFKSRSNDIISVFARKVDIYFCL